MAEDTGMGGLLGALATDHAGCMAEDTGMGGLVGALATNHADCISEDTGMGGLLGALASKVDCKMCLLKDVMAEYKEIKHIIDGVTKEKERLQQEKERLQREKEMLQHEQHANGEALAAMKEEHLASKITLVAARDAIVASTEEISQQNCYLEYLKKKLQDSEAQINQAEQQCRSLTEPIQPKGGLVMGFNVHVGVEFSFSPKGYKGGTTGYMGFIEPAKVEWWRMKEHLVYHGYSEDTDLYYLQPGCEVPDGLVLILGAEQVEKLIQDHKGIKSCDLFIVKNCATSSDSDDGSGEKVQIRSVEIQGKPPERLLGNDADNLEVTKECPRQDLVNNPTIGQTSGVFVSDKDDLEAVRDELIKGFLEIDGVGRRRGRKRKLGIKIISELSEKAFMTACLAKVPHEEVGAASCQLYRSSWQQLFGDQRCYPFITVDGNCQEIVNFDDDKLQELKGACGQGAYNAVVSALMEKKEYDRGHYELWNYKEGRKATTRECVQYMCNQVNQLSRANRKTRRSSGRA